MKRIAALCLAAAVLLSACAHVQQAAADCHATSTAVDAVSKALGHNTFGSEIAALALVECVAVDAVEQVRGVLAGNAPALVARDPDAATKLAHADAWLAAHGR